MRRLRIAIVTPGFPSHRDEPGLGAVVDLVERLALVHEVHVVALRHPGRGPAYSMAGAAVYPLGGGSVAGVTGRARILDGGVRRVRGLHRQAPFDLLHALWADEAGAVATIAGRLLGRPVIASFMGGELVRLPTLGYGAAIGLGGRLTVALSLRGADAVTTGSNQLSEAVRRRRPHGPIWPLPLGVDIHVFAPVGDRVAAPAGVARLAGAPGRSTEASDGSRPRPIRTVLFAGSLEPVKDPGAAIRAFAAVAASRPSVRLVVAGDGRLRTTLTAIAGQLGVLDRVDVRGHVPRSAMPDVYRSADVLLVTSRHESQSMVAVEAAACGLPVVGTRVGILPELGDGSRTVRIGDEASLGAALATVLDDPALAARMGHAARAVAVERFDIDRTAAAVLDAYDLVIRGGAAGRL